MLICIGKSRIWLLAEAFEKKYFQSVGGLSYVAHSVRAALLLCAA